MKQQGSDDPLRELARAREQMHAMARYSTVSEGLASESETAQASDGDAPYGKWQFLGPGNIGGRTRVLVIDPAEPRIMYTGGVSGGVWKTLNSGGDWFPVGDDLANIAVNSLAMHPGDHDTLYAGTGEGYFRQAVRSTGLSLRGDGIFVTHDGGDTWRQLPSTANVDFHYVNDLVVTATDIHAATRTGVWRSTDAGATWTRVLATTVQGGCLDLAANGGTLFASCGTFEQATIHRARNGVWQAVFTEPDMGRTSLAIAPSNPNVIYALSASNTDQGLHAVFRSSDGGDTWTARLRNTDPTFAKHMLANLSTEYGCWAAGRAHITMGWYCNMIAVDPADENRVWTAGVDLFRSDDGGQSFGLASYWWAEGMTEAWIHADQHSIAFHPRYDGGANRTVYFTNDGGVWRSNDARADVAYGEGAPCNFRASSMVYEPINSGYGVSQLYHGAVSPDGKTFLGGSQDNGTLMGISSRGPNRWWTNIGGDGGYVAIDPNDPKIMYAEYQWGHLYRSTNGGLYYRDIRSKDVKDEDFLFITPFALDPNQTTRLWIGGRVVWRSPFGDDRWIVAGTPLPAMVSALAVRPGNSDVVIAGTASGHIARTDRALTADSTTRWQITQPREGFVSSIVFDPSNPNTVFATYAGFGGAHLWMSADAGLTWSPLGAATLPDIPLHSIAVDPARPERLYLGTDLGVFVSLDRGLTWAVENTGFANAITEHVTIGQGVNGPAVYAFTHGRGVWRAELNYRSRPKRRAVR